MAAAYHGFTHLPLDARAHDVIVTPVMGRERSTLLLTPWYFPQRILSWQDAITLTYLERADVIVTYSEIVRSPSVEIPIPAVIRMKRGVSRTRKGLRFSRGNVFLRDRFACQYCGGQFETRELTLDHVTPRSRGGRSEWVNIVTACRPCNERKANLTCDEAGMYPRVVPMKPRTLPVVSRFERMTHVPEEWLPFLPQRAAS